MPVLRQTAAVCLVAEGQDLSAPGPVTCTVLCQRCQALILAADVPVDRLDAASLDAELTALLEDAAAMHQRCRARRPR